MVNVLKSVPDSFSAFLHFVSRDILFGCSVPTLTFTSIRLVAGNVSSHRVAEELRVLPWAADARGGDMLNR